MAPAHATSSRSEEVARAKASSPALEVYGASASPYTVKVLTALRYLRVPHVFIRFNSTNPGEWGKHGLDVVRPRVIPVVKYPAALAGEPSSSSSTGRDVGAVRVQNDSTFVLRDICANSSLLVADRSLYPEDAGLRFLALLLEDFFDEWGTKVTFGMRWNKACGQTSAVLSRGGGGAAATSASVSRNSAGGDDGNLVFSAKHIVGGTMLGRHAGMTSDEGAPFGAMCNLFRERQVGRMHMVGCEDAEILDRSFVAIFTALEKLCEAGEMFFFGERPSVAEFALHGQISQMLVDAAPLALIRRHFPLAHAWIVEMADLSGEEGGLPWWGAVTAATSARCRDSSPVAAASSSSQGKPVSGREGGGAIAQRDCVRAFLRMCGRVYLPFLRANESFFPPQGVEFGAQSDAKGQRRAVDAAESLVEVALWKGGADAVTSSRPVAADENQRELIHRQPPFKYQASCYRILRAEFEVMLGSKSQCSDMCLDLLRDTGCLEYFQKSAKL